MLVILIPPFILFLICVGCCIWNLLFRKRELLHLTYAETQTNVALIEACPSLSSNPFDPAPAWGKFSHLQTIYAAVVRSAPSVPQWRRVDLRNERGVIISLDLVENNNRHNDDDSSSKEKERIVHEPITPVVVIVPGITGGSHNQYIRSIAIFCAERGYHTIVFNWPGCESSAVDSPRFYALGETADFHQVFNYAKTQWPRSPLFAIGFSLGANALTNYLGRTSPCPVRAAVVFCLAFDMVAAYRRLDGIPIYRAALLTKVKQVIKQNETKLREEREIDVDAVLQASTLRQFDLLYTEKLFKKPIDDVYRDESSVLALPNIQTPLLIVNSCDDPLFPESVFPPAEVFRSNPHLIFACTRYGGHVAWAEGVTPWPRDFTYMDRVSLDWISAHLRIMPRYQDPPDSVV